MNDGRAGGEAPAAPDRLTAATAAQSRRLALRVLVVALLAASALLFFLEERPVAWPSTTGTVTALAIDAANGDCVPTVAYVVRGQQFSFADTSDSGPYRSCPLSQGETVLLRYNPALPGQGYVSRPGSGQTEHFYVAAFVLLALALVIGTLGAVQRRRSGVQPVVESGGVAFLPPRGDAGPRAVVTVAVLLAFCVWALVGSLRRSPVVAVLTYLVLVELALYAFRVSRLGGGVIFSEERAQRVAPVVGEVFALVGFPAPRVALRQRGIPAAGVRPGRGSGVLVLSAEFVDSIDDRQLRAIVAHESMHVVLGDLRRARILSSVIAVVLLAGLEVAIFTIGPAYGATYVAAVFVVSMLLRIPIGCSTATARAGPMPKRLG